MGAILLVTSLILVLLGQQVSEAAWAVGLEDGDCPSGSEYNEALEGCVPCRIGYYRQRLGVHMTCQKCPEGFITREVGAWMMVECDLPLGGRDACPSGQQWTGTNEDCEECLPGTYRTKKIDYWCVPCPTGSNTTSPGAVSVEDCIVEGQCPTGTEWNVTLATCEPCRYGYYWTRGFSSAKCQKCPENYITLNRGATSPYECYTLHHDVLEVEEDCPPGTQYDPNLKVCALCPIHTYRYTAESFTPCIPCPPNTRTIKPGATLQSVCMTTEVLIQEQQRQLSLDIQCPPGTEWLEWEEPYWGRLLGCRPCPWGTYRASTRPKLCSACRPGSTTYTSGAMSQQQCLNVSTGPPMSEGRFLSIFKSGDCPVGTSWNTTHVACMVCDIGTYNGRGGGSCTPCPTNTTTISKGSTDISYCSVIVYTPLLQSPFFGEHDCPLGSEWDGWSQACKPCPSGFYRQSELSSACVSCPQGLTTLTPGSTSLVLCSIPRKGPDRIAIGSDGCDPGYEEDENRDICLPCQNGYYKDSTGFGKCPMCPKSLNGNQLRAAEIGATDISQCLPSGDVGIIAPTFGPQSGGTTLSIRIETPIDFRITKITIGPHQCHLKAYFLVDGIVSCTTSAVRSLPTPAHLTIEVKDGVVLNSNQDFVYKADPVIEAISRLTSIVSGGLTMTIKGRNLNSVSLPSLLVYNTKPANNELDKLTWGCSSSDSDTMRCPMPDLSELITASKRTQSTNLREKRQTAEEETIEFNIGFEFDGASYYRNMSEVMPQYGTLTVQPDPVVYLFPEKDQLRELSPEQKELTLEGMNLDLALILSDYQVMIGSCDGTVQTLRSDSLVVKLCDDLTSNQKHAVRVSMARISAYLGDVMIRLPVEAAPSTSSSNTLKIVIPVVVSVGVIIILAIVIAGVCIHKRKKKEKEKDYKTDSTLSRQAAANGHIVDHRLPPLPVNSIFGPERVTVVPGVQGYAAVHSKRDRGKNMRQLALPDTVSEPPYGGMNVIEALEVGNQDLLRYNVLPDDDEEENYKYNYNEKSNLPGTSGNETDDKLSNPSYSPPSTPSTADNTPLFVKGSPLTRSKVKVHNGKQGNGVSSGTRYQPRFQSKNRLRPLSAGSGNKFLSESSAISSSGESYDAAAKSGETGESENHFKPSFISASPAKTNNETSFCYPPPSIPSSTSSSKEPAPPSPPPPTPPPPPDALQN